MCVFSLCVPPHLEWLCVFCSMDTTDRSLEEAAGSFFRSRSCQDMCRHFVSNVLPYFRDITVGWCDPPDKHKFTHLDAACAMGALPLLQSRLVRFGRPCAAWRLVWYAITTSGWADPVYMTKAMDYCDQNTTCKEEDEVMNLLARLFVSLAHKWEFNTSFWGVGNKFHILYFACLCTMDSQKMFDTFLPGSPLNLDCMRLVQEFI